MAVKSPSGAPQLLFTGADAAPSGAPQLAFAGTAVTSAKAKVETSKAFFIGRISCKDVELSRRAQA
jgi:hypothetical protein